MTETRPSLEPLNVLGFDPIAAMAELRMIDPPLGRLFDAVGPFELELKTTSSLFAALAEAIVYQQLHAKAASAIFGRVRALVAGEFAPEPLLSIDEAPLRAAGLSGSKLRSLLDLAQRACAGEIPTIEEAQRMDDEALIETLTRVRGIGRWTVEMILIFRLARPDVLPVDDFGVRKGFALAFRKREMPKPKLLAKRGERWTPYRTLVSWYLWRAPAPTKPVKKKPSAPAPKPRAKSRRATKATSKTAKAKRKRAR
ncbi:MAG TPA: hypothetical protein VHZ95_18465 [Polyangiales bacterium]|nr:hypothetical protein [Polyangiales bacterium]